MNFQLSLFKNVADQEKGKAICVLMSSQDEEDNDKIFSQFNLEEDEQETPSISLSNLNKKREKTDLSLNQTN